MSMDVSVKERKRGRERQSESGRERERERPTAVAEGGPAEQGESVRSEDIPTTKGHTVGIVSRIGSPSANPLGTASRAGASAKPRR